MLDVYTRCMYCKVMLDVYTYIVCTGIHRALTILPLLTQQYIYTYIHSHMYMYIFTQYYQYPNYLLPGDIKEHILQRNTFYIHITTVLPYTYIVRAWVYYNYYCSLSIYTAWECILDIEEHILNIEEHILHTHYYSLSIWTRIQSFHKHCLRMHSTTL